LFLAPWAIQIAGFNKEAVMTVGDEIANVILHVGGCIVMGIGVTPERYRLLLHEATNQDYVIIGPKDSQDARLIASRMGEEHPQITSLTISGVPMDLYLVKSDRGEG
jgi:hypothetical protein